MRITIHRNTEINFLQFFLQKCPGEDSSEKKIIQVAWLNLCI